MRIDKIITKRKSVKRFSNKKPDWRDIIEAIDMGRYAPMAGNSFSLKFILINEEEKIRKLAEASQQDFIINAQYAVVVCSDSSRTLNLFPERGKIYLKQQAGASIQNFLLKLEDLGLSSAWMIYRLRHPIKMYSTIKELEREF